MAGELHIRWQGEELQLWPERAVYWPRRQRLLVADLHLGKGDVFRRAGIPVPRGGTSHDLARLDDLLARTGARELLVLGDLLHGPVPRVAWRERWLEWRGANASVRVMVVAGNHDRRLSTADLDVEVLPDPFETPPFRFSHWLEPENPGFAFCGHLHPVVHIDGARLPCFWWTRSRLVLPAFSAFTGGHRVAPGDGWQGVCVPGAVVAMGAPPFTLAVQ